MLSMAETFETMTGQTTAGSREFRNPLIAPPFDDTTAYAKGAYVVYQGETHRFTAAHAAGAWTGTDAENVYFSNDTITTAQIDALFA